MQMLFVWPNSLHLPVRSGDAVQREDTTVAASCSPSNCRSPLSRGRWRSAPTHSPAAREALQSLFIPVTSSPRPQGAIYVNAIPKYQEPVPGGGGYSQVHVVLHPARPQQPPQSHPLSSPVGFFPFRATEVDSPPQPNASCCGPTLPHGTDAPVHIAGRSAAL